VTWALRRLATVDQADVALRQVAIRFILEEALATGRAEWLRLVEDTYGRGFGNRGDARAACTSCRPAEGLTLGRPV
jgi:hypothetical protein